MVGASSTVRQAAGSLASVIGLRFFFFLLTLGLLTLGLLGFGGLVKSLNQ